MFNTALRQAIDRLLPRVQMPAQYIGGELNSVLKDHRTVRGRERIAESVAQARREFAAGQCRTMTAPEIVREAQS